MDSLFESKGLTSVLSASSISVRSSHVVSPSNKGLSSVLSRSSPQIVLWIFTLGNFAKEEYAE